MADLDRLGTLGDARNELLVNAARRRADCSSSAAFKAARSCVTPAGSAQGKEITTIEGLSQNPIGKRLQDAWIAEQVPQCGYCQSDQLMAAAVLLRKLPSPSDAEISQAMAGNICRCGTYPRIRRAIHRAAGGKP